MPEQRVDDVRVIHHQPLRAPVADEIRRQIITGGLAPGSRLVEEQLAVELGVSRNPIREALQSLAREGFVHLEPRRGARVGAIDDRQASDVFAVRGALEALVAELAAARRTAAQLARLRLIVADGWRAVEGGDVGVLPGLNADFHAVLVDAADNRVLTEMVAGLIHQIQWIYTRRVRDRAEWSWSEHEAIVETVAAGDAARARQLSVEHIRHARDAYFAAADQKPRTEPPSTLIAVPVT